MSLNAAITGLKFFLEVPLDRGELMAKMSPVQVPRTLPVVLSREEAARLIAAARNLKAQTALSAALRGKGWRSAPVTRACHQEDASPPRNPASAPSTRAARAVIVLLLGKSRA